MTKYLILTSKMTELLLIGRPIIGTDIHLSAVSRLIGLGFLKQGMLDENENLIEHPAYAGRTSDGAILGRQFLVLTSKGEEVREALITLLGDGAMMVPDYVTRGMRR